MTTLMNPYRALVALLYGKWLQRRARHRTPSQPGRRSTP